MMNIKLIGEQEGPLAGSEEAAQVKADWMASISRDLTRVIGVCRMAHDDEGHLSLSNSF